MADFICEVLYFYKSLLHALRNWNPLAKAIRGPGCPSPVSTNLKEQKYKVRNFCKWRVTLVSMGIVFLRSHIIYVTSFPLLSILYFYFHFEKSHNQLCFLYFMCGIIFRIKWLLRFFFFSMVSFYEFFILNPIKYPILMDLSNKSDKHIQKNVYKIS